MNHELKIITMKPDINFKEELEEIMLSKIKNGTWETIRRLSFRLITKKLLKLAPNEDYDWGWKEIKQRLINAEFKNE